ncbi:MAG: arsenate reductase ArsC [Bacteroidetes bacterium]|nr:arsenate reductase ArsC [Bacteroidota bacterium]
MKILILCTGNSCRSQMAHGILQALNSNIQVFSAGTNPAAFVHPKAIQVMAELGLDITQHFPKNVNQYLDQQWDYVITVCGGANENCPLFLGDVKKRLHIGFTDPALAKGTKEELLTEFRKIRDEILRDFFKFNIQRLKR